MSSSDIILEPVPCHSFLSWVAERDFEQMGLGVRELLRKYVHRELSSGSGQSRLISNGEWVPRFIHWGLQVLAGGGSWGQTFWESSWFWEGQIHLGPWQMFHAGFFIFLSFSSLVDSTSLFLWPWSQLLSILSVKYWAQVNTSSSCSAAIISSLGLEESFRGSFSSHQSFFFLSFPLYYMKFLILTSSPSFQW